jgi:hypothetical protein
MIPTNDPTPRQTSLRRRVVILVVAAVLAAAAGVGGAAWAFGGDASPPVEPATPPSLELLEETTAPAVEADPVGSDAEQAAWAAEQITADLEAMNAAFAAGDREVWIEGLAAGEALSLSADASELEGQVGLIFDNMVVLFAANLEWVLLDESPDPSTVKEHSYEARIGLRYCLAPTDPETCVRSEVDYLTAWDLQPEAPDLDLGLSRLTVNGNTAYRPQPWEVTPLRVAVRDRILVAATGSSGHDPLAYIETVQAAAQAADAFADEPVGSYPLFLTSDDEFSEWYGGPADPEALGYAAYTYADTTAADTIAGLHLVLAADGTDPAAAAQTITHEAVHVATLQGASITSASSTETWWLLEGVAEYGAAGDDMPADRVSDTDAFTADGGCADGMITAPGAGSTALEYSGSYGCAYLGVRALVDEYGLEAFLGFFDAAHAQQHDLDEAAQGAFGVDYATVTEDVAAAIAAAV